MFDVGWSEMVVIGVVALVVIGPKELPGVIRQVGKGVAKLRTMAGEFRAQFDEAMREAELHEVKQTFDDAAAVATAAANPLATVGNEIRSAVEDAAGVTEVGEAAKAIEADARAMGSDIAGKAPPAEQPAAASAGAKT